MKVLHITNDLSAGGVVVLLKDILPALKRIGIDVQLLVLSERNNEYEAAFSQSDIPVFYTGKHSIFSPRQLFKLYSLLNKYDLIHAHNFPPNYWLFFSSLFIKRKNSPALVATEHSTYNLRRKIKALSVLEKIIYGRYDYIIAISRQTEESLTQWVPKIQHKIITIHNGIQLSSFAHAIPFPIHELISTHQRENKYVLMAARMSVEKDHDTVLLAMKELPENVHLVLAGTGPLLNKVKALSEKLSLFDRVHFVGYRYDLERIMKTVDIMVQSSHWEGFGLAAMEGMASGLPVVASDVPGLSEIVDGAGVLFQKGDHHQLARIIKNLLSNSEYYRQTAMACEQRAMNFSIGNAANGHRSLYLSAIKKKSF